MRVPTVGSELPVRSRWGQAVADNINAREPAWGGAPAMYGPTPPADADFITQAGQSLLLTQGSGHDAVRFPQPFPNAIVAITVEESDGNPIQCCVWVPGSDLSQVQVICFWIATGQRVNAPGNAVWVNWEAVGW